MSVCLFLKQTDCKSFNIDLKNTNCISLTCNACFHFELEQILGLHFENWCNLGKPSYDHAVGMKHLITFCSNFAESEN